MSILKIMLFLFALHDAKALAEEITGSKIRSAVYANVTGDTCREIVYLIRSEESIFWVAETIGVLEKKGNRYIKIWDVDVKKETYPLAQIKEALDMDNDGYDEIYIFGWDGGSGFHTDYHILFDYQTKKFYWLMAGYSHNPAEIEPIEIYYSDNLSQKKNMVYKKFLKKKAGIRKITIEEMKKNPKYGEALWVKMNGAGFCNGKIKIWRYKGKHKYRATMTDSLDVGDFVFYAYFKSGLVCYDKKRDEHFWVFFPESYYDWINKLYGDDKYIWFYVSPEGAYGYRIKTHEIRKVKYKLPPYVKEVSSMKVINDTLVINNKYKIPMERIWK